MAGDETGLFRASGLDRIWASVRTPLFCFVSFEKLTGFLQGKGVAVDDDLIFSRVVRDADDAPDGVAVVPDRFNEKVDVCHGCEFTVVASRWESP